MSLRYITEFIRLKCAGDLIGMQLFPNAKEITESMAAWHAIKEHVLPRVPVKQADMNVRVYCVGDGSTPRTGALIAMMSRWTVRSIDPVIKLKNFPVRRLLTYRQKVEEQHWDVPPDTALTLIVHVHSHASLRASVEHITGGAHRYLVNMPCCRKPDMPFAPVVAYDDPLIHSPKNRVEIYDLSQPTNTLR